MVVILMILNMQNNMHTDDVGPRPFQWISRNEAQLSSHSSESIGILEPQGSCQSWKTWKTWKMVQHYGKPGKLMEFNLFYLI